MKNARKGAALSLGVAAVALGVAGASAKDTYAYSHTWVVPDQGLFECLATEGNLRANPGGQTIPVTVVSSDAKMIALDSLDTETRTMMLDCSNDGQGYGINSIEEINTLPSTVIGYSFNNNNISSLAPLAGGEYKILSLGMNSITDISPLANMTSLNQLYLQGNSLNSGAASTLRTLSGLNILNIGATGVSDLSFVPSLTNLATLNAYSNGISSYSQLANNNSISSLTLSWNDTSDISPLATMTNLSELRLAGLGLTNDSYQYLENLTNLYLLDVSMNELTNVQGLSPLTRLSILNIALNHIEDFSGIPSSLTYEGTDPTRVYGQTITIDAGAATSVKLPEMVAQYMSSELVAVAMKVETWGGSYDQESNTVTLNDDADVVTVRVSPALETSIIPEYDPAHPYYLELTITRTKETTDNPDTKTGISTTAGIFGGLIAAMGALFTIKRSRR